MEAQVAAVSQAFADTAVTEALSLELVGLAATALVTPLSLPFPDAAFADAALVKASLLQLAA
jgi:hypothetical protein